MSEQPDNLITADRRLRHANAIASLQHLIDLKKAQHSARFTELRVAKDDRIVSQPERRAPKRRGRT